MDEGLGKKRHRSRLHELLTSDSETRPTEHIVAIKQFTRREWSMRSVARPPTLGIIAALAYCIIAIAPYVFLEVDSTVIDVYYDVSLAGPQFLSLLAVVALVLFAAARQGRTEPDTVAGLTLVLGVVLTVFTLTWALAVPTEIVLEVGDVTWFEYHRWAAVAVAALVAVAAVWYTRALGLL